MKNKKVVSKDTPGAINYYGQFNLLGHNGLDIKPIGQDKEMYNFFKGKIIKIENHDAYGLRVILWNQDSKMMEYHNHMESINIKLKIGQIIKKQSYIGQMGNTGMSTGPHDHFALRETDEKGYIINRDNGYNGYINPIPYIDI
jgi:murein DD-endopeptidase MepM/ murein hydrolase activator NlpD